MDRETWIFISIHIIKHLSEIIVEFLIFFILPQCDVPLFPGHCSSGLSLNLRKDYVKPISTDTFPELSILT